MRLISFLGILVMTGNLNKFSRSQFSICFNSHQFQRTCLIAYFLDYCTDDTARTLRSSYRAPEFCHFDETI